MEVVHHTGLERSREGLTKGDRHIPNNRNGTIEKTVLTEDGTVDIAVPFTRR